jgi:transposase-like protein
MPGLPRRRAGRGSAVSPEERQQIVEAAMTTPGTIASLARQFGRTRETISRILKRS